MKHFKDHKWKYLLCTYTLLLFFILLNFSSVGLFFENILSIISPFIFAIGFAFVLNIPMTLIERHMPNALSFNLKRTLSIILTLLSLLLLIGGILFFVIPQFIQSMKVLIENIPDYLESFQNLLQKFLGDTDVFLTLWDNLLLAWEEILSFASKFFGIAISHIVDFTLNITFGIVNFILSIVFAVYMLANKEILLSHINKILKAYIPPRFIQKIYYFSNISNKIFTNFISGQCLEALIIGFLCFIGMVILKIPYALLISVIVGCTSIIPIFGAFIGTVPAILIILIINPIKAIIFLIFIILLQQIEGDFIYPKVVGNSVGLPPIWVMFAMLIGGSAFGFIGLLLCIPTFGVVYKVFSDTTNSRLQRKGLS